MMERPQLSKNESGSIFSGAIKKKSTSRSLKASMTKSPRRRRRRRRTHRRPWRRRKRERANRKYIFWIVHGGLPQRSSEGREPLLPHSSCRRKQIGGSSRRTSTVPPPPPTPMSVGEILQSPNLRSFTFSELKVATRNFRPDSVLGHGGFGCVFKGWIDEHTFAASKPGAGMVVAVKRLNPDGSQGHKEWLAELNYLGQLHHPNLVKFVGYCLEDDQRLLVYEFMPRGSLENHLFRRSAYFQPLSWNLRMKIALGAAMGLSFLHSSEVGVIYRDFKASNILIDSNYNAKLSDFGLAKDAPTGDKSHISTKVMGTYGYAAPEYLATEWARPYLSNKRRMFHVLDSKLEGQYSFTGAQKATTLAVQCLSLDPKRRPSMDDVIVVLKQIKDAGRHPAAGAQSTKDANRANPSGSKSQD